MRVLYWREGYNCVYNAEEYNIDDVGVVAETEHPVFFRRVQRPWWMGGTVYRPVHLAILKNANGYYVAYVIKYVNTHDGIYYYIAGGTKVRGPFSNFEDALRVLAEILKSRYKEDEVIVVDAKNGYREIARLRLRIQYRR